MYVYLQILALGASIHAADCKTDRFLSGKTREIACLKDGRPHGSQKVYYENGTLRSETHFRDGEKHGTERRFFETGLSMQLVEWEKGTAVREISYYVNGKPKLEENRKGPLTRRIEYHENGEKSLEASYPAGVVYDGTEEKLEGVTRRYGEAGNLRSEASYKAGKKDGVSRTFYDNGRLHEKRIYASGRLVSRTEYDPGGKMLLSEEYAEDGTRK